ncbi:MAG: hypothetical protein NT040_08605 [Bacteroidetes bacterium]|nr:hypothetical protein [Bacteroidota bacterium]
MKRKILTISFIALMLVRWYQVPAQVVITNDSTAADSSAMLDVKSTDRGVMVPRLTMEQIQAIPDPAVGLVVFCTTDDQFYTYTGSDSVAGKPPPLGGTWQLTGEIIITFPDICFCLPYYILGGPPFTDTHSCCPSDPPFTLDPQKSIVSCPSFPEYSWSGEVTIPWSTSYTTVFVDPSTLTCGRYTYFWQARVGTTIQCTQEFNVYVYPDCLSIENFNTQTTLGCGGSIPITYCELQEGELSTGCAAKFKTEWVYSDDGGPAQHWCPPVPPAPNPPPPSNCNGNPVNTRELHLGSKICAFNSDCFVHRIYTATLAPPPDWPPWPASCPHQNILTIPANIYYPTVEGNIIISSTPAPSHPYTVSGSTYKICSDKDGNGTPDYPVTFDLDLIGFMGHLVSWNPPGSFSPHYSNIQINQDPNNLTRTFVYAATVQNGPGPCDSKTARITIIVEDPFVPVISSTKEWVCPNTTDAEIKIDNADHLPANATIQWYYQINCTGTWYFYKGYYINGPSNGSKQNTNLIGDQNPFYRPAGITTTPPPANPVTSTLSKSLCWKAEITPSPSSACWTTTSSTDYPTLSHGRINLVEKPLGVTLWVTPTTPQCCGETYHLNVWVWGTPTNPLYFDWYLDGQFLVTTTVATLDVTAPGDYFVRVYNKDPNMNHCDYTQSATVHITCCSVDINIIADCCSDGVTPMNLVASATSNCGNAIASYSWTGPCFFTSNSATAVLNPPPIYPPDTWSYTVTVTDSQGCHNSKTVSILACP